MLTFSFLWVRKWNWCVNPFMFDIYQHSSLFPVPAHVPLLQLLDSLNPNTSFQQQFHASVLFSFFMPESYTTATILPVLRMWLSKSCVAVKPWLLFGRLVHDGLSWLQNEPALYGWFHVMYNRGSHTWIFPMASWMNGVLFNTVQVPTYNVGKLNICAFDQNVPSTDTSVRLPRQP